MIGTTTDDASLVQAARAGEKQAFTLLLERHWALLLALCRRMIGDADLAQDIAQEAAIQAFLSLDRLQRAGQFGPWLSGIGLNICRHWLRDRARSATSWDAVCGGHYDPLVHAIPAEQISPEERAEIADLRVQVHRAVADLPPGQRAAVVLYYLHELTQAEAAAHLGIEVSAVKTRLHKARGTLRERLGKLWEEQEMAEPVESPLVEMRIDSVRKTVETPGEEPPARNVMILSEVGGPRYLLIWVGPAEADALARTLARKEWPRPATYTFMASLLQAADVAVREVQISQLVENVFYATVVLDGPNGARMVDARPSDALNLAAITGTPIRAARTILDTAGAPMGRRTVKGKDGQDVIEQTFEQPLLDPERQDIEAGLLDLVTQERSHIVFRRDSA